MLRTTGSRLAAAMLGYLVLAVGLLTLSPFGFAWPTHFAISLRLKPSDMLANVALFLPLGFLYRQSAGRLRGAVWFGLGLSALFESLQFFLPGRFTSVADLLTNTLGAGLGAWLGGLFVTRLSLTPGLIRRLALATPLMGLVYLLAPLLWVNGLGLAEQPGRWLLMALVGSCGALVLSEVYRPRPAPPGLRAGGRTALAAATWFLVGVGPGLRQPIPALAIGLGVTALAGLLAARPRSNPERRFERATLGQVLPLFILYLVLMALWPTTNAFNPWNGVTPAYNREAAILPLLDHLASFAVLGYLSAQWRGRAELPLRRDLPWLLMIGVLVTLVIEALASLPAGPGASPARVLAGIGAALFGGLIYHLQRAHIRFLLQTSA